jgi:HK97 family phage major capsid protein
MQLGLTERERSRYSIGKLIDAMARGADLRKAAPFEVECSDSLRSRFGLENGLRGGCFVPREITHGRRDMTAADAASGGYLKGTVTPPFAAALREASWLERVAVQRVVGAKDDITQPRHGSNVTTTWLGSEAAPASEQNPVVGSVALSPKYVAVVVDRSRQHVVQSADQDAQILRELGLSVGVAIATACAQGTGADGQPTGAITQVTQSVSGTSLSWTNTAELLRLVEAAGAGTDNTVALIGPAAAKTLRTRERAAGSGFILADGRLGDVPAIVTNTMPADAMLLGAWTHAMFVEWAPLEILATPLASAANFSRGIVSIRALQSVDFGVVHAAAFAKSVSIT